MSSVEREREGNLKGALIGLGCGGKDLHGPGVLYGCTLGQSRKCILYRIVC